MKTFKIINIYSFFAALICLTLTIAYIFFEISNKDLLFGIHPLKILLIFWILSFILGTLGLGGVKNGKSFARSAFTISLSFLIAGIHSYIIFAGELLS